LGTGVRGEPCHELVDEEVGLGERGGSAAKGEQLSFASLCFKSLQHASEIRIAGAKDSCEPVSATFGNRLSVCDYFKITGFSGRAHGVHPKALSDHGHETRDLPIVVPSSRAVNDFDLHLIQIPLADYA
jgi:hypothetical protein